jgi:hypothetical protein
MTDAMESLRMTRAQLLKLSTGVTTLAFVGGETNAQPVAVS